MKKGVVLMLVLSMVLGLSAIGFAYNAGTYKVPVKWVVEPHFKFVISVIDDTPVLDRTTWHDGTLTGNRRLETLDFGSIHPDANYDVEEIGGETGLGHPNLSYGPYVTIGVESNDNWRLEFKKPALVNVTQTSPNIPIRVKGGLRRRIDPVGSWSFNWTTSTNINHNFNMGAYWGAFLFSWDYENLLTRYGTYKSTLEFTAYQL